MHIVHIYTIWHLLFSTASTSQIQLIDKTVESLQVSRLDANELLLIPTQFDDINTIEGWGDIPRNYSDLAFDGFLALQPDAPALEDLISEHDLNCAVSAPNAVYGTRSNRAPPAIPEISLAKESVFSSFALSFIKIKPLEMPPFGYSKLTLRGFRDEKPPLEWRVDFPFGYHDMFKVDIEEFSGTKWSGLRRLQITADFVNADTYMDWEFCFDDLEILLEP